MLRDSWDLPWVKKFQTQGNVPNPKGRCQFLEIKNMLPNNYPFQTSSLGHEVNMKETMSNSPEICYAWAVELIW